MKAIKLCTFAISTALNFITLTLTETQNVQETPKENGNSLSRVSIENPYVCYKEIEDLLKDQSWQVDIEIPHSENGIYQEETNQILWDKAFEKIKENSQIYLIEHPEMNYLICFEDEELKKILLTHQIFIEEISKEYDLNIEAIACNINEQEILKDTRTPVLEVPYFAIYEASTQTTILLEDCDLDYYEITKAHEETHLLQGSCIHESSNRTKQSVWEEPKEYVQNGIPSPLRTISLDEYIAYIQSQKINPNYPIDVPEFKLLHLLELSFLPNQDYVYQNTLTGLSLTQNQEGFYQLFYGKEENKEVEIHKLMHTIDLCHGYFLEERANIDCATEELIRISLLEINRNFFQNIIDCEEVYDTETLLSLVFLNKRYSLYILDSYMLESDTKDKNEIQEKYLQDYEKLEIAFFKDLQIKYQNENLLIEYKSFIPEEIILETNEKNQELIIEMQNSINLFYQTQKEKSLYKVLS